MSFINPVKNTLVHVIPSMLDNGINKTLCAFIKHNSEYRHIVLDLMTTKLKDIRISFNLGEYVLSGVDSYMYYTGEKIDIPNIHSILIHDSIWLKDIDLSNIINTSNCNIIRYSQLADLPLVVMSDYTTLVSSSSIPTIDFSHNCGLSQYVDTEAVLDVLDGVSEKYRDKFRIIMNGNISDPDFNNTINKAYKIANKHNNAIIAAMPYYLSYDTQIQPNTDVHVSILKDNNLNAFSYESITASANKKLSITNSKCSAIKDVAYTTNDLNNIINLICDALNREKHVNSIILDNYNNVFKISDISVCYKLSILMHNNT